MVFNEDYIVVQITKSELEYMPAETMVFEVRYDYSPMEEYDTDDASSEVLYSIAITAPPVYIYGGPGYEYGIAGMIADNYEYTIVEEAETYAGDRSYLWGRLMSGAGWINIDDVECGEPGGTPGYILPNSSTMLLTFDDIKDLSGEQLRLARNEIYARHGRKFEDEWIRSYFESQWWYNGIIDAADFSEDMLSDIERSNTEFIMMYE